MVHTESGMSPLDYWRFCQVLTVVQATILIIGEDPSEVIRDVHGNVRDWPTGYEAVTAALLGDIKRKLLPADVPEGRDFEAQETFPLWENATILVEDLRNWLKSRGVQRGFFFPEPQGPDYLSSRQPNYSPKLAAAVHAWRAVSGDPELRKGKSVKQALDVWLRQHANEFGLTKEDGNPNEQGIQEVAKIANWETKGGAPKTPGGE
jgi:hypothetical protein